MRRLSHTWPYLDHDDDCKRKRVEGKWTWKREGEIKVINVCKMDWQPHRFTCHTQIWDAQPAAPTRNKTTILVKRKWWHGHEWHAAAHPSRLASLVEKQPTTKRKNKPKRSWFVIVWKRSLIDFVLMRCRGRFSWISFWITMFASALSITSSQIGPYVLSPCYGWQRKAYEESLCYKDCHFPYWKVVFVCGSSQELPGGALKSY